MISQNFLVSQYHYNDTIRYVYVCSEADDMASLV